MQDNDDTTNKNIEHMQDNDQTTKKHWTYAGQQRHNQKKHRKYPGNKMTQQKHMQEKQTENPWKHWNSAGKQIVLYVSRGPAAGLIDPCKFKRINLVSVALFGALGT